MPNKTCLASFCFVFARAVVCASAPCHTSPNGRLCHACQSVRRSGVIFFPESFRFGFEKKEWPSSSRRFVVCTSHPHVFECQEVVSRSYLFTDCRVYSACRTSVTRDDFLTLLLPRLFYFSNLSLFPFLSSVRRSAQLFPLAADMNKSCDQFGIRISNKQVQTTARVLQPPCIQYNKVNLGSACESAVRLRLSSLDSTPPPYRLSCFFFFFTSTTYFLPRVPLSFPSKCWIFLHRLSSLSVRVFLCF